LASELANASCDAEPSSSAENQGITAWITLGNFAVPGVDDGLECFIAVSF
jgi:hypothetical protein